jgi:hypothetical protein
MMRIHAFLKPVVIAGFLVGLIACGGGDGSSGPVFDPNIRPQNVQAVAGTGEISGPQNTLSWNSATAATDYVVYCDDVPGVTSSSNVLVPASSTQLTHVGLTPGVSYYYRVEARAGGQVSVLSDEVTDIPQSSLTATAQNLLEVAWNGADTLVAVGNSGVIIHSSNGTSDGRNFAAVNPLAGTNVTVAGVTWDGARFLAVGGGGSVLTSADGDTWVSQNSQVNIDRKPSPGPAVNSSR